MPEKKIAERVAFHVALLLGRESYSSQGNMAEQLIAAAGPVAELLRRELGQEVDEARCRLAHESVLHFRSVFETHDLPETPVAWYPVPQSCATAGAMLSIAVMNALLGLETISYRSENDGELFVNLVALPGAGALAEKSVKGMRGHTDAASFPFPGEKDPNDERISPAPDVVCLAGLRNKDSVPTQVIPLASVLAKLDAEDIDLLKEDEFVITAQRSFRKGTEIILGEEHSVIGGAVLMDALTGQWVRYSHSNITVPEDNGTLVAVQRRFEQACESSQRPIILGPGDLAVINNRSALHGRAKVGADPGGDSRWLLRSYGMDTSILLGPQHASRNGRILFP